MSVRPWINGSVPDLKKKESASLNLAQTSRGSVTIEFVLLLPLFFSLILAIIELSSLIFNHEYLSEVAYNAVSVASRDPLATSVSVAAYVAQKTQEKNLSTQSVFVTPGLENLPQGSELTVTIIAKGSALSWSSTFPVNISEREFTSSSTALKQN